MSKRNLTLTRLVQGAALSALFAASSATAQNAEVDPYAIGLLAKMADYTSGLEHFHVETQVTLEDVTEAGQRVDIDTAAKITVKRPNKVRAERVGEVIDLTFYYNGSELTLYNPDDNIYATIDAPPNIEQMLDFARENLMLVIPVSDLMYSNMLDFMARDVVSATVVGTSRVSGMDCTHLAFRLPDVDYQIWIAEGEKALPCKYVVTDTSTDNLISTVTVMSNWNTSKPVLDRTFEFSPPKDAEQVDFLTDGSGGEQ